MFMFHNKKCLAFTLSLLFTNAVYSQSTVSPSLPQTPLPLPYISDQGQGCSVFEGYSTDVQNTCSHFYDTLWDRDITPEGVLIINRARGGNISEAAENWLILVDGSGGTISASEARPLNLKRRQALIGVVSNRPPVLSFPASSPAHLIHVQGREAVVRLLQLEGINSGVNGALLYMSKPVRSHISQNILNTTAVKSIGIDIDNQCAERASEPPSQEPDAPSISLNTFNLSGSSRGIRISCSQGKEVKAVSWENKFNLSGDSNGLQILGGGFYSRNDTFTQTGPATSKTQAPVAILFNPDSETENNRPFHRSTIQCNQFDGGNYGDLVPISLAHFIDSDEPYYNQVKIAYNVFRNVPQAVRVVDSSQAISANSICNIWIPGDSGDTRDRCPDTLPINGFLHFIDGVTCGSRPDNFVEPDCPAEYLKACGNNLPAMEPALMAGQPNQPVETMAPRYHQRSDGDFDEGSGSEPGTVDNTKKTWQIGGVVSFLAVLGAVSMIIGIYSGCRNAKQKKTDAELRPILQ